MPVHRIGEVLIHSPDAVRVPLIGQALCAGFPSPADDFLEGALELPRWLVPNPPATFLWRIAGSSMEGAGIYDRDLAFCNPDLPAFAVDELGEGVIWGVVRFSIRWHVARGQLS